MSVYLCLSSRVCLCGLFFLLPPASLSLFTCLPFLPTPFFFLFVECFPSCSSSSPSPPRVLRSPLCPHPTGPNPSPAAFLPLLPFVCFLFLLCPTGPARSCRFPTPTQYTYAFFFPASLLVVLREGGAQAKLQRTRLSFFSSLQPKERSVCAHEHELRRTRCLPALRAASHSVPPQRPAERPHLPPFSPTRTAKKPALYFYPPPGNSGLKSCISAPCNLKRHALSGFRQP